MADTITRIDDLERRVFRVERHLGLATARDVERVLPRPQPPTHASPQRSGATDAPAPVAPHDWMDALRSPASDPAPAPSRRAVMEQFLQREAPARISASPGAAGLPLPGAPTTPPPLPPRAAREEAQPEIDLGPDAGRAVAPTPALTPASPQPLRYEARPPAPQGPPKQSALEQVIGLKLAGWVGAIVLVIGAGLGIKYAYDQGFFSGVHPAIWLSLLYACGFALLGAGELVYRRINKISATGLFGAGVATLFLVSYAGHGYYELYQQQTAFTLMALSTLIGAAVAMRGKLVSIAALSLVGGLLAPLVLKGDANLVTPFLAYLLMLQVVALVLSWWGGGARWWTLRGLSLAGTSVWMSAVLWKAQPWGAAMAFTFLYAALYHAEVIFSAFRKRLASREDVERSAGVGK
jgi:uncharacterized membrane protein